MERTLAPLPYKKDALEPYVTGLTVEVHYERHHHGYLKKLLELVEGKPERDEPLETLIRSASGEIFENAAQVWNHDFFWKSLKPGGSAPGGELLAAVERDFGSLARARAAPPAGGPRSFRLGLAVARARLPAPAARGDHPRRGQPAAPGRRAAARPSTCGSTPTTSTTSTSAIHYVGNVIEHLLDWDFAAENLQGALLPVDGDVPGGSEAVSAEDDPNGQDPKQQDPEFDETERVREVPVRSAL